MLKILTTTVLISLNLFAANLVIGEKSNKTLNIYNNFAYIQEQEILNLDKKIDTIYYKNIPSSIITDSINISSNDIYIKTQEYIYNKPDLYNILKENINKEVEFYLNYKLYKSYKFKKGKLISVSPTTSLIIVEKDGNTIYSVNNEQILIKNLPENMFVTPFLKWKLFKNNIIKTSKLNLNYLCRNIKWNSEYNAFIDDKNEKLNISGWFNIKNNSGIDFKNINVNIVAGNVNNIDNTPKRRVYREVLSKNIAFDNSISEKTTVGLKKYSIPFRVSLNNNQNTQINFINTKVNYKLVNKFSLNVREYKNLNARQYIKFKNETNKSMPAGNIRFYKDTFLGSNKIKDLSKNMEVELYLNNNFDIYLNNKILKMKKKKNVIINNKRYKTCYYLDNEISITNNNKKSKNIEINLNYSNKLHKIDYSNVNIEKPNFIITKDFLHNYKISFNIEKEKSEKFIINTTICEK